MVMMGMIVAVIMAMSSVGMVVTMMVVTKTGHTDQVNYQAQRADYKQLQQALGLSSFRKSINCLDDNFDAN